MCVDGISVLDVPLAGNDEIDLVGETAALLNNPYYGDERRLLAFSRYQLNAHLGAQRWC